MKIPFHISLHYSVFVFLVKQSIKQLSNFLGLGKEIGCTSKFVDTNPESETSSDFDDEEDEDDDGDDDVSI